MTHFNFVEPSVVVNKRRPDPILLEFAEALRARPGEWAEWPVKITSYSYARAICSRITNGGKLAPVLFREGFEGCCVKGVPYVRYVGEREL